MSNSPAPASEYFSSYIYHHYYLSLSLETSAIYFLLSVRSDMWSIVKKSTSEPKTQRKAYHLKDTLLFCEL